MGMRIETEGIQVRLKAPKVGDVVRLRSGTIYFYLPDGLPEFTEAVVVGREPGRYIVQALGREWNIAFQCVEHEKEMLLGGRWLNQWDRRVRRAQAMIDRLHASEKMRAERRASAVQAKVAATV